MSKCAASFARLSSHHENSKSTSGYLCELKQILVELLRAFNRGKKENAIANEAAHLLTESCKD